ncbi:unnamed protein product [Leptosia nina]|uniref:Alcohol dehydrogenase n=1 Tax=Leptosia nina TaxID=320188 RepID=A0AAV1JFR8_9NEOP
MAKNLKNKVVVITGGATGIGYEIADRFLSKGAKIIIILDINEEEGKSATKKLNDKYGSSRSVFYKCDVTSDVDSTWTMLKDTYECIDVFVNNAGIVNEKIPKKAIDINVTALIDWSLKFWEYHRTDKSNNGGTIINLASIYGFRVDQFIPVYQATKFAVMGFTKALGHEYNFKRTGVRVVAICPGFTKTNLTQNLSTFDEETKRDSQAFLNDQQWQTVDAVGSAAIEVFENAASGRVRR